MRGMSQPQIQSSQRGLSFENLHGKINTKEAKREKNCGVLWGISSSMRAGRGFSGYAVQDIIRANKWGRRTIGTVTVEHISKKKLLLGKYHLQHRIGAWSGLKAVASLSGHFCGEGFSVFF